MLEAVKRPSMDELSQVSVSFAAFGMRGVSEACEGSLTCRVLDACWRAPQEYGADWVRAGTGFVRFF